MRSECFIKTFIADEAIGQYLCVKIGSADGYVGVADAATDAIIGIADSVGATASGDRCEVVLNGTATCKYGDTVTRGDRLTAESGGMLVPAAPAATATARVVGIALTSGVDGDLGTVLLAQHAVTNGANS